MRHQPDVLEAARDAMTDPPARGKAGDVRAVEQNAARIDRKTPVIRLNTVVLPAPFGPISAVRVPRRTAKDKSSMTLRPPKRLLTQSRRRMGRRCHDGFLTLAVHWTPPQLTDAGRAPVIRPSGRSAMIMIKAPANTM